MGQISQALTNLCAGLAMLAVFAMVTLFLGAQQTRSAHHCAAMD